MLIGSLIRVARDALRRPERNTMGTTADRTDPALRHVDPNTGLQDKYLVLSEAERAQGFVRPVRRTYIHQLCGTATTMGQSIAETYARDPSFYGATYCAACKTHFPVGQLGQFVWDGTDIKVGT